MAAATKLYIGNLPEGSTKEDLEPIFSKYGTVVEFDILKDYGFIHYETEEEATAAAEALDGYEYSGQSIRVEVSRSKVRQKAGMGGKGECYRCGGEGHWSKECPRGPRSRGGRRSGGGGGGRDRYNPYGRDFYPPDPYDFYARARMYPPFYDRYGYDRRLPPFPPHLDPLYRDFGRGEADYYRRPSPPRDPYYDYYERRGGAAAAAHDVDEVKPIARAPMQGRVPGPY